MMEEREQRAREFVSNTDYADYLDREDCEKITQMLVEFAKQELDQYKTLKDGDIVIDKSWGQDFKLKLHSKESSYLDLQGKLIPYEELI